MGSWCLYPQFIDTDVEFIMNSYASEGNNCDKVHKNNYINIIY